MFLIGGLGHCQNHYEETAYDFFCEMASGRHVHSQCCKKIVSSVSFFLFVWRYRRNNNSLCIVFVHTFLTDQGIAKFKHAPTFH